MKTQNVLASALLFLAAPGCAAGQEAPAAPAASQAAPAAAPVESKPAAGPIVQRSGAGRVGADDIITIYATNCEEISRSWRITTKGELHLPLVGKIQAAG